MPTLALVFIGVVLRDGLPLPEAPARVVSVAPTATEIVCALGACPSLVGVTRFDDFPPEVSRLPKVGGFVDPSPEAIINLKPDLVVLTTNSGNRALSQTLTRLGVPWLAASDQKLDDFAPLVTTLAQVLHRAEAGQKLLTDFERQRNALAGTGSGHVLVVMGHRPLVVAGNDTFVVELLSEAGYANAYRGGLAYATLDFEALLGLKADVVLDLEMDNRGRPDPTYFDPLRSRLGHLLFAPDPALLRLGPRLLPAMQRLLHQLGERL